MKMILLNKPYNVMCQFSAHPSRQTLSDLLSIPNIYPAGRLDADSEGLILLTDDGKLQNRISHPDHKQAKIYLVQVEGQIDNDALQKLMQPINLGDFTTQPCRAKRIQEPGWLWPRNPPIRTRSQIPTSWLWLELFEGKNRQVRRMTAAIGYPTLRLIRSSIGGFSLENHPLMPGEWAEVEIPEYLKGR